MPSIYFNGEEIDEVDDDVYFNGTSLAIGYSVYFNGEIVWTKQAGCVSGSSGTTYQQWSTNGTTGSYNVVQKPIGTTATIKNTTCASSTVSVRAGADNTYAGEDGWVGSVSKIFQNNTEVASVTNTLQTSPTTLWSSWITRTVAAGDEFVLGGYSTTYNQSINVNGQMYTSTTTSIVDIA